MFARVAAAKAPPQSKTAQPLRASRSEHSARPSPSAQPAISILPPLSWNFRNIAIHAPSGRNSHPRFGGRDSPVATEHAGPLPWPLQAKLVVGAVDDPLEREADRMAETVMRIPDTVALAPPAEKGAATPAVLRRCACGGTCADCKKRDPEQVQTKRGGGGAERTPVPASVHGVLRSGGQPLDRATRAFMEPRFGRDFSRVRVHSNAAAQQSARDVNAHAYTLGQNIVFAAGRFTPATREGRRLIAHELVHVVQQDAAGAGKNSEISSSTPDEPRLMRSVALDSTLKICRRVLQSSKIKISQGGLRVALLLKPQDTSVLNCVDHDFMVTLNRSNTFLDDEVASCSDKTGGNRSFSFGNLSEGEYYLTISRNFDNPGCCLEGDILVFDENIAANSSACVPHKGLSALDIVHGALDIAGLIPVLGAIPDGINAGIYAVEGDWVNAGISVGAMIPFVGDGVLVGKIGAKTALKFSEKAAVRLGEEGIAKALRVGREAAKAEKTAVKVGEDVAKVTEKAAVKDAATATKEAEAATKEAEATAKREAEEAAKKAADEAIKKKIKLCLEIYAAKTALGTCKSCKATDTKVERAAKIACLTAEIAARDKYLKEDCDDVLPGSIERVKKGQDPKAGHRTQLLEKTASLAKCATLPTID